MSGVRAHVRWLHLSFFRPAWSLLALTLALACVAPGLARAAPEITCLETAISSVQPEDAASFESAFSQSLHKRSWTGGRVNLGFQSDFVLMRVCLHNSAPTPSGPMEISSSNPYLLNLKYTWKHERDFAPGAGHASGRAPRPEQPSTFFQLDPPSSTAFGLVPFAAIPFRLEAHERRTLLVVLKAPTSVRFAFRASTAHERMQSQLNQSLLYVFCTGTMLAVALFWLVSWLSTRRKEFLFYGLFALSYHVLNPFLSSGLLLTLAPAASTIRIILLAFCFSAVFQALFLYFFLDTGRGKTDALFALAPPADRDLTLRVIDGFLVLTALCGIVAVPYVLSLDSGKLTGAHMNTFSGFLLISCCLGMAKAARARAFGLRSSSLMVFAFGQVVVGSLVFRVYLEGFLQLPPNARLIPLFLTTIEGLTLSYVLQTRFRHIQMEHVLLRAEEAQNRRFRLLLRLLAHDLASSATHLGLNIERALREATHLGPSERPLAEPIRKALSAAREQRSLLQAVMRMENPETLRPPSEDAHLSEIVRGSVDAAREKAVLRGIDLKCVLAPEMAPITLRADAELLGQSVLGNLLSNAIKFTRRGGKVEVKVEADTHGVNVFIEDEGPGISRTTAVAASLGSGVPSQASPEGERGNGLGLVVAHETTKLLGGSLILEPKEPPRRGTIARIQFPWTVAARQRAT